MSSTVFAELEALWHEHHAGLLRHAKRYVGPDLAEDVVQDTFCKALKAMLQGKGYTESARGWVYRIQRNLIIDHYRSRDSKPEMLDIDAETRYDEQAPDADWSNAPHSEVRLIDTRTPYVIAEENMTNDALYRAIAKLPDRQQGVAAMRLAGYEYEDISAHVGCGYGASKALMHRAYANLRERLEAA